MRPRKRRRVLAMVAIGAAVLVGGALFAPVASATTTSGSQRRATLIRAWFDRFDDRGGSGGSGGSVEQPAAPDDDGDGGAAAPNGNCSGVTVIAVRGTGEPAGTGFLLGAVARQIDQRVDVPVEIVGLDYPAAAEFVNSPRQGVTELNRLVDAADADACLVLLGYSQGAIVVGDALAGFDDADGAKVSAVVMFGDPRFNSVEPYNLGTFGEPSRGLNPRRTDELADFDNRIQDYCNGGDVVCQGGGARGGDGHLAYNQFATQAATFVAGAAS